MKIIFRTQQRHVEQIRALFPRRNNIYTRNKSGEFFFKKISLIFITTTTSHSTCPFSTLPHAPPALTWHLHTARVRSSSHAPLSLSVLRHCRYKSQTTLPTSSSIIEPSVSSQIVFVGRNHPEFRLKFYQSPPLNGISARRNTSDCHD